LANLKSKTSDALIDLPSVDLAFIHC